MGLFDSLAGAAKDAWDHSQKDIQRYSDTANRSYQNGSRMSDSELRNRIKNSSGAEQTGYKMAYRDRKN